MVGEDFAVAGEVGEFVIGGWLGLGMGIGGNGFGVEEAGEVGD